MTSMQWGSSLLAIFLAFDLDGWFVCEPKSGVGASGGVGTSGCREELSCSEGGEVVCAIMEIATNTHNRQIANTRLNCMHLILQVGEWRWYTRIDGHAQ